MTYGLEVQDFFFFFLDEAKGGSMLFATKTAKMQFCYCIVTLS